MLRRSLSNPFPQSAAFSSRSLADQSRYVSEALRHLFSAQKAAALESRQSAKELSLQQQEALERLSDAQTAANKAHAAAAAALANVHKNGIYGGEGGLEFNLHGESAGDYTTLQVHCKDITNLDLLPKSRKIIAGQVCRTNFFKHLSLAKMSNAKGSLISIGFS